MQSPFIEGVIRISIDHPLWDFLPSEVRVNIAVSSLDSAIEQGVITREQAVAKLAELAEGDPRHIDGPPRSHEKIAAGEQGFEVPAFPDVTDETGAHLQEVDEAKRYADLLAEAQALLEP